jgi:hypothetical protein
MRVDATVGTGCGSYWSSFCVLHNSQRNSRCPALRTILSVTICTNSMRGLYVH